MTASGSAETPHLRALTSLRFVAALFVVLYHLSGSFRGLESALLPARFGYVGVTFFFLLSGFVLAWNWKPTTRVGDFYLRRFARVYPLYLFVLATALILPNHEPIVWSSVPQVLLLVQSWSPDLYVANAIVGPAWSLSVEAFFYAVFPLIIRLLAAFTKPLRAGALVLATAVCITLPSLASPGMAQHAYYSPPLRLFEFVVGVAIAQAMQRGWRPRVTLPLAVGACAACYSALLVAQMALPYSALISPWSSGAIMVPPLGLLIATAAASSLNGRRSVLHHAVMVRFGRWSYALYLVHAPLFGIITPMARDWSFWPALPVGVFALVMAIAVSGLLYRWVEHPLEKRIRRRTCQGVRKVAPA